MAETEVRRDPVLFYGALALIVLMPSQWSPVSKIPATPADALVFALFGWLALMIILGREKNWVRLPGFLWIFAIAAAISALRIEPDPEQVREVVKETVVDLVQTAELFILAPLVLLNGLRNERDLAKAVWALCIAACATVLIGVGQLATRGVPELDPKAVHGLFGSRTLYGTFLATSLPILYALSRGAGGQAWRKALAAACLLGLISVVIAGPFLALVGGLIIVSLLLPGNTLARVGGAASVLIVACCVVLLSPLRSAHVGGLGILKEGSREYIDLRYAEWQAGFNLMRDGPRMVLGNGPGQYQEVDAFVVAETDPTVLKLEPDFQNQYVVYGVTFGLSGLLAYVYILYSLIRSAWAGWKRCAAESFLHTLSLGVFGGLVAFAFCNLYANAMVRGTGITFGVLACFAVLVERLSQASPASTS